MLGTEESHVYGDPVLLSEEGRNSPFVFSLRLREGRDVKKRSFLVSFLVVVTLVPLLLISAPTAASDKDDDDNDTATCLGLLAAFGKQSDNFNTQLFEALAKAWPDPEETGEVWAEYFEELADLFEEFGEDLADAECSFPAL